MVLVHWSAVRSGDDLPDGVVLPPGLSLPPQTLRGRKRIETMRRVQEMAIDLFLERGFDNVTIEQIAEAAEVSPSTIYRHFGTKERLVLHDEYDELLLQMAPILLRQYDPLTATEKAMAALLPAHMLDEAMLRRVRLWFDHPGIKAAGYLMADEMADQLAAVIAQVRSEEYTLAQARFVVGALVGALLITIRRWHEEGATGDLPAMVVDGIKALRRALA